MRDKFIALSNLISKLRHLHGADFMIHKRILELPDIDGQLIGFINQFLCGNGHVVRTLWLENDCGITFQLRGVRREIMIAPHFRELKDMLSTFPEQHLLSVEWGLQSPIQSTKRKHSTDAEAEESSFNEPVSEAAQTITASSKRKRFIDLNDRQQRRIVSELGEYLHEGLEHIKASYHHVWKDNYTAMYQDLLVMLNKLIRRTVGMRGIELEESFAIKKILNSVYKIVYMTLTAERELKLILVIVLWKQQ